MGLFQESLDTFHPELVNPPHQMIGLPRLREFQKTRFEGIKRQAQNSRSCVVLSLFLRDSRIDAVFTFSVDDPSVLDHAALGKDNDLSPSKDLHS